MYREEYWEPGHYIVNHQKYNCPDCKKDFIVGKELLEECSQEVPVCPYCGENHAELTVWTEDDQLQELSSELGCLTICMNKQYHSNGVRGKGIKI